MVPLGPTQEVPGGERDLRDVRGHQVRGHQTDSGGIISSAVRVWNRCNARGDPSAVDSAAAPTVVVSRGCGQRLSLVLYRGWVAGRSWYVEACRQHTPKVWIEAAGRRQPWEKGGVSLVLLLVDQTSGRLSPRRAGPWKHMRALLTAGRLDRALAQGAQPEASVELALRSQRLVRPSVRGKLARSLQLLLATADRSHPAPRCAVPLCRDSIAEAAADIRALIECLVASGPVAAHGVAQVWILLGDGCGPLYSRASSDSVRRRVQEAILALDPLTDV